MDRFNLVAACFLAGVLLLFTLHSAEAAPLLHDAETPHDHSGEPAVIAAAGNIADCAYDQDSLTAYLLDSIDGAVLTIGDAAYEAGSLREYLDCYDNTWGRHFDRTYPAPGNRDYGTQGAEGYYTYFGDRAAPLDPGCTRDCKGYYSFDLGDWHIISLNSEAPNSAGSEQEQWLRADLAANDKLCTLAYWHRPRFSSTRPAQASSHDLWNALYDYGADVVLSAHWHNYERFAPQDPGGQLDRAHGIRQFVLGTGGRHYRDFDFIQPNSEVRNSETWGVLKMTLYGDHYDWEYIPIPGQSFTDSGSSPCVSPANAPAPLPGAAESTSVVQTVSTDGTVSIAPSTAVAPTRFAGTYVVNDGDTLFVIARDHSLTLDDIVAANGIANVDVIEIGDVLQIPGDSPAAESPSAGDSDVDTTTATESPAVSTTVDADDDADDDADVEAMPSASVHIVVSGDTIIGIALRYDLNWQDLLELNSLTADSMLQLDQRIRLE